MTRYLTACLILCCLTITTQASTDSLLNQLTLAIAKAPDYDAATTTRINQLRSGLTTTNDFAAYHRLYTAYRLFNYDSAYRYAEKLRQIADQQNNPHLIIEARLQLCFILLSSGLFRETYDSLKATDIRSEPDSLKATYYTLLGRYYYDLANYDYDGGRHSVAYDAQGNRYMDSAITFYPKNSFEQNYYAGLLSLKQNDIDKAAGLFDALLKTFPLTDHQLALVASTLSGIEAQKNKPDEATNLMITAAIADIRSSTKETYAVFILADMLFKKGDVRHASLCIETAIANAEFYGARQRKVQVSSILSLIESERINAVETQRRQLILYAIIVTALLVALAFLIIIIRKQVKKLQKAQQIITKAHEAQRLINNKLEEANKIKEEYIGYFFSLDSEFFVKLQRLKRTLDQKVADRKFEDIRFIVNNIQLKKEKEDLLRSFDTVFLRIFPHFVTRFNALFKEEDQVKLKENELLNIDLRIFALIRLGITDNEKIAQILEYSVNTIYAYKTRIKNRSIIPNDEFEARILEINSI